jgi:hypothetical protein
MKLTKVCLGILASASLGLAGLALAADSAMQNDTAMTDSAHASKTVNGQITQVLKADHELLLSNQATPLVVDKDAKVTIDGKSKDFSDLKPGFEVRAAYDAQCAKIIRITATSSNNEMNPSPYETK